MFFGEVSKNPINAGFGLAEKTLTGMGSSLFRLVYIGRIAPRGNSIMVLFLIISQSSTTAITPHVSGPIIFSSAHNAIMSQICMKNSASIMHVVNGSILLSSRRKTSLLFALQLNRVMR
jgi:hypothetical protein